MAAGVGCRVSGVLARDADCGLQVQTRPTATPRRTTKVQFTLVSPHFYLQSSDQSSRPMQIFSSLLGASRIVPGVTWSTPGGDVGEEEGN